MVERKMPEYGLSKSAIRQHLKQRIQRSRSDAIMFADLIPRLEERVTLEDIIDAMAEAIELNNRKLIEDLRAKGLPV